MIVKELRYSTRFKKDLKRYKSQPAKVKKLRAIVDLLLQGKSVPQEFRPHMLVGQYEGCMECHIGNDFLLIWVDESEKIIKLMRLGSHAQLFGM